MTNVHEIQRQKVSSLRFEFKNIERLLDEISKIELIHGEDLEESHSQESSWNEENTMSHGRSSQGNSMASMKQRPYYSQNKTPSFE
jgi:hypothetical protein